MLFDIVNLDAGAACALLRREKRRITQPVARRETQSCARTLPRFPQGWGEKFPHVETLNGAAEVSHTCLNGAATQLHFDSPVSRSDPFTDELARRQ